MRATYESIKNSLYDFIAENEDNPAQKIKGKFIDMRVDHNSVPDGKYAYDCRHADDGDWTEPVTVEPLVMVNFCGTLIADEPIEWPDENDKYIPLTNVNTYYHEED